MGIQADVALVMEINLAVIVTLSSEIERLEKRFQESLGNRLM
jgi:hypothetical protein